MRGTDGADAADAADTTDDGAVAGRTRSKLAARTGRESLLLWSMPFHS
jgi:hypothetical protein